MEVKAEEVKDENAPTPPKKKGGRPKKEAPVAEVNTDELNNTSKKVAGEVTGNSTKKKTTKKKTTKKVAAKKTTRKPKNSNEALADFICLMADTNISESAVEEIIEMISNKKAAEKAVERDYQEFSKAADALNKVEETKAKTGISPVSTEQHKKMMEKAAAKGARYERFKALADKKFN